MANVSRPDGFKPVRHLTGAPYNGQVNLYTLPATDSTAVAVGDLVDLTGTADADGIQIVARQNTVTGPWLGAIVGFRADPTALQNSGYRAASTQRYVLVADSPDLIFEAQAAGTFTWNTSAGLLANTNTTAASTNGGAGLSNMVVDMSTATTATSAGLRILGPSRRVDQDTSSTSNVKVEVQIKNHRLQVASAAGGV